MSPPALEPAARRDVPLAVRIASIGSVLIGAKAVALGLRRRDAWFSLLFQALVWIPLSGTLPFSFTLVFLMLRRWLVVRIRSGRTSGTHWRWSIAAALIRLWAFLEVAHFVRYKVLHRALSRQRHLPPRTRQAGGRRLAALRQQLRSLELALSEGLAESSAVQLRGRRRSDSGCSSSAADLQQALPAGPNARLGSQSRRPSLLYLGSTGALPSAESLLRYWDSEADDGEAPDNGLERSLQLKRADLSGWFWGADVESLQRGNLEEWLAEYFFHNSTPEDIALEDRVELDQMVDEVASFLGCPDMAPGTNPAVQCKRLSRDPVQAIHRPLFFYAFTGLAVPALTDLLCTRAGFEKFTSGVIQYWHRPSRFPPGRASSPHVLKSRGVQGQSALGGLRAPIVFCHGLGIGVLPYVEFVRELGASGCEMFLLDLPHISLRQHSDVPSSRETVACVVDMLAAWGHSEAHFVGHSFGTTVVSWLVQNSQVVLSASLLDPVCFLLVKHDILTNALYREHVDPLQVFLTFFVFRELYVAHTLARNFFWQQNDLMPELLQCPAVVLLSGKDEIVPAHSVHRRLGAERSRRKELLQTQMRGKKGAFGGEEQPKAAWSTSCGDLRGIHIERASELRGAKAPLEVLWFPNIVHCEFAARPALRAEVVEAVISLCKQAETPQH